MANDNEISIVLKLINQAQSELNNARAQIQGFTSTSSNEFKN